MWQLDKFKNNTAVITESGEKITYGELDAHCHALTDSIAKDALFSIFARMKSGRLPDISAF